MLGRQMVVQTVCGRGKGIFRDFPSKIKYKNCICSKQLLFSIKIRVTGLRIQVKVNRVRAREEGMGCTQRETRSPAH